LNSLLEVVSALASARTLEDVIGIVRRSARALTRADGVSLMLHEQGMCHYVDEDGIAPSWKNRRFPLDECICGWAMLHRQTVVVSDVQADSRIPHEAYSPSFVKSLLIVPMLDEKPLGAIGAYWAREHVASGTEQQVLRALANAAALALRNVQLNGELERTLQGERDARQRAEDTNKLKDDFLATLSHELRSPLHVIQSWIWQLGRSASTEEARKAVEIIERNASLQARLVEDLLDMSRASSGKLKLRLQLVNLAAMCTAVVEVEQPTARAKNIHLEIQRERSPYIWGDPDRIQQILWNVLNNAIKFTPANGRIVVRVTRTERRVRVAVEDSGIGVDPEFLPFMFDRFRQADQGPTRRFSGLGLGLTIVRELSQLHGATVQAESNGPDTGTTIAMEFPVPAVLDQPRAWQQPRASGELAGARLDGISVLVVDDEPEGLASVQHILEHHGALVVTAGSADEALRLLGQHRPHLLLSDLAMPVRDGLDLVRAVRELESPLRDTPAAALSAHQASEIGATATQAGFQLYMEKPVRPQELVGQIARLAARAGQQASVPVVHPRAWRQRPSA
jgi:signal transduction histidine kinase/ActR/RegA family two-component response regulator